MARYVILTLGAVFAPLLGAWHRTKHERAGPGADLGLTPADAELLERQFDRAAWLSGDDE